MLGTVEKPYNVNLRSWILFDLVIVSGAFLGLSIARSGEVGSDSIVDVWTLWHVFIGLGIPIWGNYREIISPRLLPWLWRYICCLAVTPLLNGLVLAATDGRIHARGVWPFGEGAWNLLSFSINSAGISIAIVIGSVMTYRSWKEGA